MTLHPRVVHQWVPLLAASHGAARSSNAGPFHSQAPICPLLLECQFYRFPPKSVGRGPALRASSDITTAFK